MSPRSARCRLLVAAACLALPAIYACDDAQEDPATRLSFQDRSSSFLPDDRAEGGLTLEAADLDGDGRVELIVGYQRSIAVWTRRSEGRFLPDTGVRLPSSAAGFQEVRLADLDGDGDLDMILATLYSGLLLWIQRGGQNFVDETAVRLPQGLGLGTVASMEVGDLDGDGAVDLFVSGGGGTHILLNRGNGVFRRPEGLRLPEALAVQTDTRDALFAELSGDEAVDLVVDVGGLPELLEGRRDGSFRVGRTRLPRTSLGRVSRLALIDLDQDGDQDIAAVSDEGASGGRRRAVLRDEGAGDFRDLSSALLPAHDAPAFDVRAADIDLDGDEDLVFATATQAGVEVFVNEGDSGFADRSSQVLPDVGSVARIRVLDIDGDGDLDILAVRPGQRTALLINQLDPGPTPTPSPTPVETPEPSPTPSPTP